jgi:hypothetical protein
MGKRYLLAPCVLAGAVLFGLVVWTISLVPSELAKVVGVLLSLGIAAAFVLAQKSSFEAWKQAHWTPQPDQPYRPNWMGRLILMGLGCLVVEVGIIFVLVGLDVIG